MNFGSQGNRPRLCILPNAGLPGAINHLLTKTYFGNYADKTKIYVNVVVVLFCFIIDIEPHIIYNLNIQPNIQGS